MEEYIKKLLEQVRFEKAHKAISDEIRSHIEDQIADNIYDGMDEETAEKMAVEEMGDPVDAGISLDKIHRPQIAWGIVAAAVVVALLGSSVRIFMSHDEILQGYYDVLDKKIFIICTVLGIGLMLLLYFIDFTTVAKYSRAAGRVLLASIVIANISKMPMLMTVTDALKVLMVPLYAGIIYKYKDKRYEGFVKALIWIAVTVAVLIVDDGKMAVFAITIGMLLQLTIAINKRWIRVPEKPVYISMWSIFVLFLTYYIYNTRNYSRNITELASGRTLDLTDVKTREFVITSKMVGTTSAHPIPWVPGNASVMTYILGRMGIFAGIAIAVIVTGLIIIGFVAVFKTKNQLGLVMGSGCMMWLAANTIVDTLIGFGIFPDFGDSTFLPFISGCTGHYKDLIAAYAMLGILLSIYRFKNAYPEHVEIRFSSLFRKLELRKLK